VGSLPGVPPTAFINDIKADLFDASTVYVALDNHKYGDYAPYLLKSTDRGRSWTSLAGSLPERTLVWRLVQDHEKAELLFLATEFGIYFSVNGGEKWIQLKGGLPVISFRDLAIQRRENDLVGASFGRSFYVLDDYSPLRSVTEEMLAQEAALFTPRKAWWYIPRAIYDFDGGKGDFGAGYYVAPNPPFGAVFTYHLAEDLPTLKAKRKEAEKPLQQAGKDVPFPGWEALEAERRQPEPRIWLIVRDSEGQVVRRVAGPTKKGFHRVAWDLRYPAREPVRLDADQDEAESGFLVPPGSYTVTLAKEVDGLITTLSYATPFEVERLQTGALEGAAPATAAAFWRELEEAQLQVAAVSLTLRQSQQRVAAMKRALAQAPAAPGELDQQVYALQQQLYELDATLNGNRSQQAVGDPTGPTVRDRLGVAVTGTRLSTYGPTPTHRQSLDLAQKELGRIRTQLETLQQEKLPALAKDLEAAGAPWIEGQPLPGK
jgi:hypothetical protein